MKNTLLSLLLLVAVVGVLSMVSQTAVMIYQWTWALQLFMGIAVIVALLVLDIVQLDESNPYFEELSLSAIPD